MKRFFQYTAGLIICIFFSVGVWGQVTLVEWNFPNNPDNATADGGIPANSAKTIGAYEEGVLRSPNFGQAGVTTNAANIATIWDAGNDYWQFDVNSVGYSTLTVSFSLLSPNNTSPKNFKAQYNTGSGWVDFGSSLSLTKNVWATVTDQALPLACENLSNFSIRIITTDDVGVNGTQDDSGNNRIDNIIIKGTAIPCSSPTISSFSPTSACSGSGSTITINGSNFVSGGTTVTINGTSATPVTFVNSGQITVPLPAGASGTGNIVVTTCAAVTSGSTFTVNTSPSGGSVSGSATVCSGATGVVYSYSGGTPSATSWSWSVPAGATITAGAGTSSITVSFGSTSGNVSCTPTAGGCTGSAVNRAVTVNANLSAVGIAPSGAQSICANGTGSVLTATETGGGTITGRQWGKRSVPGGAITAISGATGSTYTPTGASLGTGTWYIVCTSTPTCGSAIVSNEVTVTVNSLPVISGTTSVCISSTTSLTSDINPGTWSSSNSGIASVNSSTGVVTGVALGSATISFTVTATGCVASTSVTVTNGPSTVTVTPASATLCSGTIQSLVASGGTIDGTLLNEPFAAAFPPGWTTEVGSGDVIATSNTASAGGTAYEAKITGNSQSTNITDRLYYGPINTTGSTSLTLQWNNYLDHYSVSYAYSVSVQTSSDGVTWHNTTWVTNPVTADIGPGLQTLTISTSDVGSSTFYLAFTMSGLTFGANYWYIDNVLLSGSIGGSTMIWSPTTELYTDAAATLPYSGTSLNTVYAKATSTRTYTATSTASGCSNAGSSTITVSAGGATINTQPSSLVKCAGESAVFTVNASSPVSFTYQWRKAGVNISGATSSTLTLNNVSASDAANYDVVITPACGAAVTSNTVSLTVNAIPATTASVSATSVCSGGTLTLTGGPGSMTNYLWTGPAGCTYNTSNTIQSPTVTVGSTSGTFTLLATNASGCTASASTSLVTVSSPVTAAITPSPADAATAVCYAGSGAVSSVSWASVSGATSYDVYFGAGSVPGTVTANVLTNSYSTGVLLPSTTYYWKVVPKNFCGDFATPVTWSFTTASSICYCPSSGTASNARGITNVSLNTINNTSSSDPSYEDYTAISTNLEVGLTYSLNITVNSSSNVYTKAWIDWNIDGDFTDTGEEYIISSSAAGSGTVLAPGCPFSITVPAAATVGSTRMRISSVISSSYTSCSTGTNGDVEDYTINVTPATPMVYLSSTTTQTVTSDVTPGASLQQIIGIQVVTTGSLSPIELTQLNFNTDGTTSPGSDVFSAKVWYTGTSSTFATTTQFGSTFSGPNGVFAVNGSQTLNTGTNYFWLTYDIPAGATINNFVDAECNQITISAVNQVPTQQDPVGNRQIRDIYLISDPSTVNVCSGTFYDSGAAAGDYGNDELYTKTFVAATPGSALQFAFTSFATESGYDYLYIYDGPTTASPQIPGSPFNGTTSPGTINSSSQYMTFVFDTDGSGINTGWAATISCVAITVPDCITYNAPADTEIDVCPGSVSLKWTGATTGFIADNYKLYFGTDDPPTNIINGIDVGTTTSYDVTNLDANTAYYWRIAPSNTAGSNNTCAVRSFTTLNLGITSTTGLTTCQNTGNISATGGGTITWYDVPTGGSPIGTGSPFGVTFSGNTTYYVAAESSGGGTENGGRANAVGADGSFITTAWGVLFDATEDFTIVSTKIYPVGTGTVTIALLNDAGTEIASTSAINVTGTGLATPVVLPLGFGVTVGSNYKIVVKAYTGITGIIRDFSSPFPYPSPSGAINVKAGWSGSSTTAYYWFYDVVITGGSCVSAREPVSVVHTAEPITITPDGPTTFLDGGSVGLTASSAAAPAYTYTWSPATGLNTTTGATVIADPNTTTTYTVTGTNGTCTNTEQVTITVTYPCTGLGTGHTPIASLPFNETSTTCGKVDDITSSNAIVCSSTSYYTGEDVVYSFTPTNSGLVTIDLSSTGTFTGLMLYEGCPMSGQGGSCVAQSQSSTGNKSMCINLQQDLTYYLVVDSYDAPDCNPYTINISSPDPVGVANDYPCSSTPIAIGGLQAGDNSCSSGTDEPTAASCWTTGTLNTVWYSFTAPASGTVKIRTTLGTLTATQIAVYQGTCDNLTMVVNSCNVDASGVCSGTTNNSAVELTGLVSGNTYYIRIDGENDLTGDFDLEVIDGINNWPFVPQQDCGSATLICNQQTIVGDPGFLGAGSTCDYTTPYGCFSFGTQNNTVWYQIDIAANGTLIFDIIPNLSSTDYDWALINFTANPTACDQIVAGTLSPIRCNFSGTSGTTGLRVGYSNTSESAGGVPFCSPLTVNAGDTYQLLIWNWSGNNTGFNLDMQATSPVNYASPTSLTWSGGASTDWFNPVNWGGCAIPDCDIDVIIVNGPTNQPIINADGAVCKSISIESGASLTVNANRTLTVCNDFSNIGSLNMDPTATILLNNNGADHELDGSLTGSNALGNLTVNKTSGSVTFMQDIEIQGDLTTANATSIINVNGKNVTLGGDFVPWDGTYTNIGTGILTFNGTSLQNYNPGGLITLHDVTMNNSGAGLILSRNLELSATGVLTLNNGIIDGDTRRVVIANTDPSAVSLGNANSYVYGELRRYMAANAGNYYFPVGTTSAYRLAQLVNNNLTGINYIDAYFSDSFVAGTISASDLGTPYSSVASEGIWTLTPNAQPSAGTYSILLYFNDGGSAEPFSLTDNMFGPLKRLNSSQPWVTGGGTLNTESTPGRTVAGAYARRSGLSDFSDFAIGKSNTNLPVTLLYVNAKCADGDVYVNWATAQEINNSHFTILRSEDAKFFYPVGKIIGAGNSQTPIHYSFMDENFNQKTSVFYKVVQTDFDGTETCSQIVVADCSEMTEVKPFIILNSSNSNSIDVQFFGDSYGKANISIVDNLGRVLTSDSYNTLDQQFVSISKNDFAPGLYSIVVSIDGAVQNEQFVVVK